MSEGIGLQDENLCTSEDAFEQFQSTSMSQEEEFITLSDIVSPNPKVPDLSSDLKEVPYENEVVLTSNIVDVGISDVNKPVDTACEMIIEAECATHTNSNIQVSSESTVEAKVENTVNVKRRGRKKKITNIDSTIAMSVDYQEGKNETEGLELPFSKRVRRVRQPNVFLDQHYDVPNTQKGITDITVPSAEPKRKRGRPRKEKKYENLHEADSTNNSSLLNETSIINNEGQETVLNDLSKKTVRRKRPRTSESEIDAEQINIDVSSSGVAHQDRDSLDNVALSNFALKPSKQYEKSHCANNEASVATNINDDVVTPVKGLNNEVSSKTFDDKPEYSDAVINSTETLESEVKQCNKIDDPTIKLKRKRGRPRKNPVENVEKINKKDDEITHILPLQEDNNDEADDICLSNLKQTYTNDLRDKHEKIVDENPLQENLLTPVSDSESIITSNKRNAKVPIMADFEYNIDSIVGTTVDVVETVESNETVETLDNNDLLVEDPSKRPSRRKARKILHYDDGSDEDPFANVELSDDDEPRRKGHRYCSDDEYVPHGNKNKRRVTIGTSSNDSEDDLELKDDLIFSKRKSPKKSETNTPKKRGRKSKDMASPSVTTTAVKGDEDVEEVLNPTDINNWGTSNEFDHFIAKKIQGTDLQIKKLSSNHCLENAITPLDIPTALQNAQTVKDNVDISCQTNKVLTVSTAVQTSNPNDVPMNKNIALTTEQTEKACEFLNNVVETTAELGKLMTQKSEDFIKKKINTTHVVDTSTMDYCVKKSFLLFKLAKHNLLQMEEDLAKQYEEFLQIHNLSHCRGEVKKLEPKPKVDDSDSDCEIVEVSSVDPKKKSNNKPAFNPKTVFLNKELSIKIAKKTTEPTKPTQEKPLNIKGRHTVWINDSVMVKKVTPTQYFLAQDSRNQKPPDNRITTKMVSDFFRYYERQKALATCSALTTTEWKNYNYNTSYVCSYFVVKPHKMTTHDTDDLQNNNHFGDHTSNSDAISNEVDTSHHKHEVYSEKQISPQKLLNLCIQNLQKQLNMNKIIKEVDCDQNNELTAHQRIKRPETLIGMCLLALNGLLAPDAIHEASTSLESVASNTCHTRIVKVFNKESYNNGMSLKVSKTAKSDENLDESYEFVKPHEDTKVMEINPKGNGLKTLFSLCFEFIQCLQKEIHKNSITNEMNNFSTSVVSSLKHIALVNIKTLIFDHNINCSLSEIGNNETSIKALTINEINTLTEEAFHNIQGSRADIDEEEYLDNDESNCFEDESNLVLTNFDDNAETDDNSWVSQVQMQELRSCLVPNIESENIGSDQEIGGMPIEQIKVELAEEICEEDLPTCIIKPEPSNYFDEMTCIPDDVITKAEPLEQCGNRTLERLNSNSYDENLFESFVTSHKMIHATYQSEEVFTQSGLRVRRQFEPDCDDENDTSMSLLVPQASEPLHIEEAKGSLMESSDDDASDNKVKGKKKITKRKSKQKNTDLKSSVEIATYSKENNDDPVSLLTRKMREKIRKDHKLIASSDSESELSTPHLIDKHTKDCKLSNSSKKNNNFNDEIQCNNVDSTAQINEYVDRTTFRTGFNADNQININSIEISEKHDFGTENAELINSEDTLSADENEENLNVSESRFVKKQDKLRKKIKENAKSMLARVDYEPPYVNAEKEYSFINTKNQYTDRNGWKCYPVNRSDSKLYHNAVIKLVKLPESFVETYHRYQGMIDKNKEDAEINRLINISSLNRKSDFKDGLMKTMGKHESRSKTLVPGTEGTLAENPTLADSELSPSEDEEANVKDEVPAPRPGAQTENNLAKECLMDDDNSDADGNGMAKVKRELDDKPAVVPCPKQKKADKIHSAEDFVLTVDKTMNMELMLLNAPIDMKKEPTTEMPGPSMRLRQRNIIKNQSHRHVKPDPDSSSEDEKRVKWVNTKEKLLKRVLKTEDASIRDAKRAKLVNDFIVRRGGDAPDRKFRGRGRRSFKKFLEREKQVRVLSKELFGESSADAIPGKRSSAAVFKGRRNIRKVIDKKSLTRSTVLANMEEFERKRRLNLRQNRLRELLGCEEGVNVLVINDEVCLEYDFEVHRPVVSVHPFFTKVMKAHQYEGVKFMWDACFESLESMSAGRGGSGCILAHCMGLGKTLQVLALLHTVLTHPKVGMRRVLVCCPLSTVLNWVDEIHKWIGPVTDQIKVFELSKLKKTYQRAYQLEDWYEGGGIFIISYELFRSLSTLDPILDSVRPAVVNKIRKALLDPGPDIVVCDEGHLLKNDSSVLAVAMSRVVTKRRIVLTGTPMQNNLREYYCMVNFIKPNLLGTYSEYSNRFENPIMNGQHRDSREEDIRLMKARTHILHKVLEGCLQRQEASVLYPYLPKKHEYTVFVPLTKCQWDLYKHYLTFYANHSKNSVLKDFHILQKIWSHPQVLHNFQTRRQDAMKNKVKVEKLEEDEVQEELSVPVENTDALDEWWLPYVDDGARLDDLSTSNKFLVVFRVLHECVELGDKVLIFSTSLFCLDTLEFFLKKINKWSLGHEYYRLDGSVPAEVRQKWCREFNAENNNMTKLFLISTRAGCLGLNMTGANRVIILDTSWNPAHDIQSIFRVYRFGQKKDCFIYRLVALGTMEQKIYERSVTKQAVACRVVDEQQIERHYNMSELTELYQCDEEGGSVAGGVAVGVCDVALLRVARDAPLHAVHEHDSLLRGSSEQGLPEHERAAAWMQFQQEHAHKQRQNEIDTEKEMHTKNVIEKHGHIHLNTNDIAQKHVEVKVEQNASTGHCRPQPEPKGKKGKRDAAYQCIAIKQDEQRAEEDDDSRKLNEEETLKRIVHILIRHNFQNRQGHKDIANLVQSVRHIIKHGPENFVDNSDKLAASIAKVLIQGDTPASNTANTQNNLNTNTLAEEEIAVCNPAVGNRIESVTESAVRTNVLEKSATATATSTETIRCDDTVNVDDDDDDTPQVLDTQCDDDSPTGTQRNHGENSRRDLGNERSDYETSEASRLPKRKDKSKLKSKDDRGIHMNTPNEVKETANCLMNDICESIVLSDEDEPPPVAKSKPGPASERKQEVKANALRDKEASVPLHPSLLMNNNFIRIVAHTYLASNPMMDEVAAFLAAQYSTHKAFKEASATGEPILKGPIYDIAVNSLGLPIMKKLHDDSGKINVPNLTLTPTEHQLKKKAEDPRPLVPQLDNTKAAPSAPAQARTISSRAVELTTNLIAVSKSMRPNSSSPRPIGLIRRIRNTPPRAEPSMLQTSVVECILPDDEDASEMCSAAPEQGSPPGPGRLVLQHSGTAPALSSRRLLVLAPIKNTKPSNSNSGPPRILNLNPSPSPHAPPSVRSSMPNATQLQPATSLSHSSTPRSEPTTSRMRSIPSGKVPTATPSSQLTTASTSSAGRLTTRATSPVTYTGTTICLDSDEDETPPVVPVSLSVNPAYRPSLQSAIAAPRLGKPAPTVPTKPTFPNLQLEPERNCRPGDILRLTKRGSVEIVSKQSSCTLLDTTSSNSVVIKKVVAVAHTPVERQAAETGPQIRKRSSSKLNSDDPLSVLKDVVQIQAGSDYTSRLTRAAVAPRKEPLTLRAPITATTNPKLVTAISTSKITNIIIKDNINKSPSHNLTKGIGKSSNDGTTIDLTDAVQDMKGGTRAARVAVAKMPGVNPQASTSRSLLLNSKSNKHEPTADIIGSSQGTPANAKRAPAVSDTGVASKKKKLSEMTLKDFDLDDIDDIIELE